MSDEAEAVDERHFEQVPVSNARRLFRPKVPSLILTYSEETDSNVMTAMWWTSAAYRPAKMLLAVEHDCHTYDVLQNNDDFVMAMPTADMIDAVTVCGQTTGVEVDKFDELDLETAPATEVDAPLLLDAGGNVECKTVHTHTYDGHTYFFAEPKAVHVRKGWFEDKVLTPAADPLLYLGSHREDGETVRFYTGLDSEFRSSRDGDHLDGLPTAY